MNMYTITFTYFTYLNFITDIKNKIMAQDDKKNEDLEIENAFILLYDQYTDKLKKKATASGMEEIKAEELACHTFDVYLDVIVKEIVLYKLKLKNLQKMLKDKENEAEECVQVFITEWKNEQNGADD